MDALFQDVRHALRGLRRNVGFTLVAVLTLGLGIGANTAIFSLVEAVLLRTLPVSEPGELRYIAHRTANEGPSTASNYPYFERLRERTDVFAGVTAYSAGTVKVASSGEVEVTSSQFVSGNFHGLLGVPMALGRGFVADSDRNAADALVAVISDGYWMRRFGRDPAVLGQTLRIDGRPVSIVGVTAPGFEGLNPGTRIDITLPISLLALDRPEFLTLQDTWTSLDMVARLRPGVSDARAGAAVEAVFQQYLSEPENEWFRTAPDGARRVSLLLPADRGYRTLRERYSTSLAVLMGIVGVVLLIGCVNVANLLLARAAARAREVAVRTSLGAGRARLVRHFLTESLVLAGAGGAVGILLAAWGTEAIVALFRVGPEPVLLDVRPNLTVLAFTAAVSMLTGLAFGLAPALRGSKVDLMAMLRASGAGSAARPGGSWSRQLLVAGQIALCLLLLAGTGLLVGTLQRLNAVDAGFERENVLIFSLDASGSSLPAEGMTDFCADVLARMLRHGGTVSGSCSTLVPADTRVLMRGLRAEGMPEPGGVPIVFSNLVGPDYFRTFGIRLERGRVFTDADSPAATKVAILNEAAVRFFFGEVDPVGRTVSFQSEGSPALTVVGVAADTRQASLREEAPPTIYTPLAQAPDPQSFLTVALRATTDPALLAAAARREVRALRADVPVGSPRTMEEQIAGGLRRERVLALLSTWFSLLAVLLACIGLYGVMSYDVSRRTREIGIRMAIGATRLNILRQVLRRVAAVAVVGVALGLVATLAATRVLSGFLYGVSARDPLILGGAAALLVLTALVAGSLPARAASLVDPARALRSE